MIRTSHLWIIFPDKLIMEKFSNLKTKLSQQLNSHKIEMNVKVKRIDVKRLGFTFKSHLDYPSQ